jgi:hypothetical protein
MKRLPGLKSFKTVKEALASVSKECKTYHEEVVAKIAKGNEDLIKGMVNGPVQKRAR